MIRTNWKMMVISDDPYCDMMVTYNGGDNEHNDDDGNGRVRQYD